MKVISTLIAALFILTSLSTAVHAEEGRSNPFSWPLPKRPEGVSAACFPEPRLDWMGRFYANLDKLKDGPYDLVFDGDSITENFQYAGIEVMKKHYAGIKVLDNAIGGDQVEHVTWRLRNGDLAGQNPKLIVILAGSANVGQKPEDVADGVKLLLQELKEHCPHSHILLMGFLPRGPLPTSTDRVWAASVTKILSGFGDDQITFIDIGPKLLQPDGSLTVDVMPDYLHPSVKGYEIWADAIQPIVDKYIPIPAVK